jgi:hypothetical protein
MQSTEEYTAADRDLLDLIEELEAAGNHGSADYYREHLAAGQAIERGDYQDAERILKRPLVGKVYVAPSRDVVRWAPVHRFRARRAPAHGRARRERRHVARATSSSDPGPDDPDPPPAWLPCPACGQPLVEKGADAHCGGCPATFWGMAA